MRAESAGPMPLTERRSSALQKTRPESRAAAMRPAKTGPTPGNKVKLSWLHVLMGKGVVRTIFGGFSLARADSGPAIKASSQRSSRQAPLGPTSKFCRTSRPAKMTITAKKMPKNRELFSKPKPSASADRSLDRCSEHRWSGACARR